MKTPAPALLAALILALTPLSAAEVRVPVLVTMPRLVPLVEAIGGERVEVRCVVPEGADPHHYEPGERELLDALTGAQLLVMTGPFHLALEEKVKRLAEKGLVSAELIDYEDYLEEGLVLLQNPRTGSPNPHGYVFSLHGLEAIARAVARGLSKIDPEGREYYEDRLESYLDGLRRVEEAVEGLGLRGMRVILLTPILQYVADDLGLEVVDVVLPELDIEPSEHDVSRMLEELRRGEAELLLLSDLEAGRHGKLLSLLKAEGVSYAIVPILQLPENPEFISLSAASILRSSGERGAGSEGLNLMLASSIAANLILLVIVMLLIWRVKRYGG